MTISRRALLQSTAATALLGGLSLSARAQAAFESVKIITGFPPGGTSDTICRRVAAKLAPGYGKSVVVENRTGAGGQIAIQGVKGMAPDGSTLLATIQDRIQTWAELCAVDPATGAVTKWIREESPTWVNRPESPRWRPRSPPGLGARRRARS